MSERHTFVSAGISREAFQDSGIKLTTQDDKLDYYIHMHKYTPVVRTPCNEGCQIVRHGEVAFVTQTADAKAVGGP